MEKLSIQGECAKLNWYKVLDCIDQLKQDGWFIQERIRNEDTENHRIDFNYTMNKNQTT